MLRIATLHDSYQKLGSASALRELTKQLRLAEIDVLCCQGMRRTLDGKQDPAMKIAESLQMTYSFSATHSDVNASKGKKELTINGLSILAGAHVWMLNSGSFSLPGDHDKKQVAQFAVVRQNGNSVVVINAELSSIASVQLQQLEAVFTHHLFQEHHGAVVLCSNGHTTLSPRDLQSVTALSTYKFINETTAMAFGGGKHFPAIASSQSGKTAQLTDGMIFTLTSRKLAPNTVRIKEISAELQAASLLTTEFEFKRSPPEKRNDFFFPLSFSEQRLEFRDSYRGTAASAL